MDLILGTAHAIACAGNVAKQLEARLFLFAPFEDPCRLWRFVAMFASGLFLVPCFAYVRSSLFVGLFLWDPGCYFLWLHEVLYRSVKRRIGS